MNASLFAADRRTRLKVVLAACMCSLGAYVLATNLSVHMNRGAKAIVAAERLVARDAPKGIHIRRPLRTSADEQLVTASLQSDAM
jgi:hypothetical protein